LEAKDKGEEAEKISCFSIFEKEGIKGRKDGIAPTITIRIADAKETRREIKARDEVA